MRLARYGDDEPARGGAAGRRVAQLEGCGQRCENRGKHEGCVSVTRGLVGFIRGLVFQGQRADVHGAGWGRDALMAKCTGVCELRHRTGGGGKGCGG